VEGVPGAERRIQVDEVHPAGELGQECWHGPQVVAGDQPVPECAGRSRESLDGAKWLDAAVRPGPRSVGLVLAGPGQL
jgi:hypothetical protein